MSTRRTVTLALLATLFARQASAVPANNVLVSGQPVIATIDADNDGPDAQDCNFVAVVSSFFPGDPATSTMTISGTQSNMPSLAACLYSFTAQGVSATDESSHYAGVTISDSSGPTEPAVLPIFAELFDETPNPDANEPVHANDPRDGGDVSLGLTAAGRLCSAGAGIAALVDLPGAPSLMVDLNLYGADPNNPTHLEIPGPPPLYQLASGGHQPFNAFLPITPQRHITVANADNPSFLFVDIDLSALPACGSSAPTLSQGGLLLVVLAMLAGGTLVLRRRRGFARAVTF